MSLRLCGIRLLLVRILAERVQRDKFGMDLRKDAAQEWSLVLEKRPHLQKCIFLKAPKWRAKTGECRALLSSGYPSMLTAGSPPLRRTHAPPRRPPHGVTLTGKSIANIYKIASQRVRPYLSPRRQHSKHSLTHMHTGSCTHAHMCARLP